MAVYRVKIRWQGFSGAPGYTILHFDAATSPTQAGAEAVHTAADNFAQSLSARLASAVTIEVESGVEVIDQTNNQLQTIFSVTTKGARRGTVAGGFSSSTGACIVWETGEVRNGRRVRGRTFIVPLASTMYDIDGTLTAAAITGLTTAAQNLTAGGFQFGVLARPTGPGASDGSFHTASSGRINDKTAILRSRRD